VAIEPPVLAERLRISMIHLSRRLRRQDVSELSIAQMSGLASVVHKGPLGIGRLAELESLPGSAATRLADKLEAAGLVVRQVTPGDRRGVQVVATPAGVAVLERYARWRRLDNLAVALACDGFVRLFSNDNPLLRLARGAGIGIVNQIGALRRLMMGEAGGAVGDLPRLLRGEAL